MINNKLDTCVSNRQVVAIQIQISLHSTRTPREAELHRASAGDLSPLFEGLSEIGMPISSSAFGRRLTRSF